MKKSTTSERLRQLMHERNIKQIDILSAAEKYCDKFSVKMNKSDISQYVSGKVIPSQDKLTVLSKALEVDEPWLMGYDVPRQASNEINALLDRSGILQIQKYSIPLLGTIQCGEPTYAAEEFEGYVEVGSKIACDFALRAKGDSMIGARIHDGDIVFIRKQPTVMDGEIAAVVIDDETTLKRVRFVPGGITMLMAENPKYSPIIIGGEGETRVARILGKAVAFQADVR